MLPLEPVRSQIFAPIRKFYVNDADWPFIIIFTFIWFAIPYYFRWTIFHVPVSPFSCFAALCASVAFFAWTVKGKRPRWLKHWLRARREKPVRGRALSSDLHTRFNQAPFLLDPESLEATHV